MPQALKLEAAHYFGSLEKAISTLKKQGKRLPGWNRRKIVATLSRMNRSRESLAYATARREISALVSAAEAHFGSCWNRPKLLFCASHVAQTEIRLVRFDAA